MVDPVTDEELEGVPDPVTVGVTPAVVDLVAVLVAVPDPVPLPVKVGDFVPVAVRVPVTDAETEDVPDSVTV